MFRVHNRSPEPLPLHQRDFPPKRSSRDIPGAEGSGELALMVACYLVALFAGIVLLGHVTEPTIPSIATASNILDR